MARAESRINLRVGIASTDTNGRPTICMEVRAVAGLSFEGCGTGTGFLHSQAGAEMAHFRAKWRLGRYVLGGGLLHTQLGAGLAELQLDADQLGFVIDPDAGSANAVEAVGPEASLSLKWLKPLSKRWEFVVNASGGLAWIPGARDLRESKNPAQPFVSIEAGIGW